MYQNKTVTAIIPCYNEGPRIQNVLTSIIKSKLLDEIIVIDDGSTDNSVAKILELKSQITLLTNKKNLGKAKAVFLGIKKTKSDLIFTLDSDLIGLRAKHIDLSIIEFLVNDLDMLLIPVSLPSSFISTIATSLGMNTIISGQRIFKRKKVLPYLHETDLGYGLEMYINKISSEHNWKVDVILWKKSDQLHHTLKVDKYGLVNGLKQEFKMLSEVLKDTNLLDYLKNFNSETIRKYRNHES